MKSIFIVFLIFFQCYAQETTTPLPVYPINNFDPTYENIAKPEEVLVVYRGINSTVSDTMSLHVKNYYISKRGIPEINTIGLTLPDTVTIDNHLISLLFMGELIHDENWEVPNTSHAWQYFITYIFNPIQNYLNTTLVNGQYLKDRIKYIVLCKGIPLKINPYVEFSGNNYYTRQMVTVDGLLCLLSQTNSNFSLLNNVFGTDYSSLGNPYFNADKNFDGTYRFKSKHFSYTNYEINYLVSRLDGLTYNDVINLIDKNSQPDLSGNNLFMLDAHYSYGLGVAALREEASKTKIKLDATGYNNFLDTTDNIYYTSAIPVIGYTSSGRHAGMPYYYNYLFTFDKPNGAIYNTYESYNGFYMDTLNLWNRQADQGMITEWIRVGGSGGAGHIYEPTVGTISKDSIFFPLYSIGYSLVDAVYQGIPYIAFRNIVVGDPLTTIAWGKQTLTQDVSMSNTNLVTGVVTVPLNNTITLDANAVLRFKHNGFITGDGSIITDGKSFEFQIEDWDRSVFRSSEDNHPKIIWGEYPIASPTVVGYNIYRKWEQGYFSLIGSTDASTFHFVDNDVEIFVPTGEEPKNAEYYVKAILYVGPGTKESDPSNTIDYWVDKVGKIKTGTKIKEFVYELEQNYPNPFNPVTTINYQIQKDGIVMLKVFDILGKEVATLVNENKVAGNYSFNFNASQLSSGLYIYQLITTGFTQARKMILAK